MIKIKIPPTEQEQLSILRYSHPNKVVRRRFSILYFKSLNHSHGEIEKLAGASSTLITKVFKIYATEGLKGVADVNHYSRESDLEDHRDVIAQHFQEAPPTSAKEAAAEIYKLTNLQRGETQTKVFLRKLGLRPRKTAAVPAKANIEMQEDFKKKVWCRS
jgi:transposase